MFKVGDKVVRKVSMMSTGEWEYTCNTDKVDPMGVYTIQSLIGSITLRLCEIDYHGSQDCFELYKANTKVDQSAEVETKYDRTIIGKCGNKAVVDVYRVLDAFEVHNPMLSHLAKKALCAGLRGHKGYMEDLLDIQKSINEAIKLEEQR